METLQNAAWPYPKDIVIQVNPAKRKKIFIFFTLITIFMLLVFVDGGPLADWSKHHYQQAERDKLAPTMQKLADEGKPDAILWLANNFPGTETSQLETLAAQGNGQAMMLLAEEKWKANQHDEAMKLVARAAAVGYVPAVKYQMLNVK